MRLFLAALMALTATIAHAATIERSFTIEIVSVTDFSDSTSIEVGDLLTYSLVIDDQLSGTSINPAATTYSGAVVSMFLEGVGTLNGSDYAQNEVVITDGQPNAAVNTAYSDGYTATLSSDALVGETLFFTVGNITASATDDLIEGLSLMQFPDIAGILDGSVAANGFPSIFYNAPGTEALGFADGYMLFGRVTAIIDEQAPPPGPGPSPEPNPVPLPASAVLLLAGLGGLAFLKRRVRA